MFSFPCKATARSERAVGWIADAGGAERRCGALIQTLLNIIWLLLSGLWLAIGYGFVGLFITILGIPFGRQLFKIAGDALWPFGREAVRSASHSGVSTLGNVALVILAGLWFAIGHIATGALPCLTIIGIPLGVANIKMVPVSLMPFGREIVPSTQLVPASGSGP